MRGKPQRTLGKFREWPSIQKFKLWRTKHINAKNEAMRDKMSPL